MEDACGLATDFMSLVVEHMSAFAWDSTFWSDEFPARLVSLLDKKAGSESLDHLERLWTKVVKPLEKILFKESTPDTTPENIESQLVQREERSPETIFFYKMLDICSDQQTREILLILDQSGKKWSLQATPKAQETLTKIFGVSTTKTYCEDVFRDVRHQFEKVPSSQITLWARQQATFDSLLGRGSGNILPVLEPSEASLVALKNMKHKLVTSALFTPPTNSQRCKKVVDYGQALDLGCWDPEIQAKPLIDLQPLLSPKKPTKKRKAGELEGPRVEEAPGPHPYKSLFLLPATKESHYAAASAWGLCSTWKELPSDLELRIGQRWWVNVLHTGFVFEVQGRHILSLGSSMFAALGWTVEKVTVKDGLEIFVFAAEPEIVWLGSDSLLAHCYGYITEVWLSAG